MRRLDLKPEEMVLVFAVVTIAIGLVLAFFDPDFEPDPEQPIPIRTGQGEVACEWEAMAREEICNPVKSL